MKLMKLGNRPDIFFTSGNVRYVQAEVPTDLQIQVEDVLFRLHKFPLLSKCLRLQALCTESSSSSSSCIVALELPDFPGGADAFDACARFCYGVPVTVGAHNVVPLRCAAARLGMAESGAERGNLAAKLDAFLASCLLRRWKDALAVLRATAGRQYAAACEELGVTSRCVDAVAALVVSAGPTAAPAGSSSSAAWWARDVSDLDVGLFWRVMVAVKATGAVPGSAVGDALRTYARRWLPSVPVNGYHHYLAAEQTDGNAELVTKNHRLLVEKLASLLPAERHAVSCSFLLKLLKAANILGASTTTKTELTRRAAMQLEDATVSDLLIPSSPPSSPLTETVAYDVDAVLAILEEFTLRQAAAAAGEQEEEEASHARWHGHRRSRSAESATELDGARRSSSASHGAVVRVGRLVDGFLVEAAKDVSLPLEKMVALAEAVPDCARPVHDDLYRAVDTYLRAHPGMDKSARKKLCRVLNCRKLSEAASLHAAQNELLPLRVVVQVLFFENARAAASNPGTNNNNRFADLAGGVKALLTRPRSREVNTDAETKDVQMSLRGGGLGGAPAGDDDWSVEGLKRTASRVTTLKMKLEEEEDDADDDAFVHRARAGLVRSASSRVRAFCTIPAGKPKRMLSRLWSSGRAVASRS
ncbi:hypothetical protein QOZ80_4BG0344730 [Eleusine coracana subsp. coracana]|nr:hypothetical protein QOZ80_4BG0344730 [Eleusine coracana subsp. coracana]